MKNISAIALSLLVFALYANAESRVAFCSNKQGTGGTFELYTMKHDGTDLQRLTTNTTSEIGAVVSPDGSLIACVVPDLASNNIAILPATGGAMHMLANTNPATSVQWGNSNTLYFLTTTPAGPFSAYRLCSISTTGMDQQLIFPTSLFQDYPIAPYSFCVDRKRNQVYIPALDFNTFHSRIFTAKLTDTACTNVLPVDATWTSGDYYAPSLSPDGTVCLFCADQMGDGAHVLRRSAAAGGTATNLMNTYCGNPSWFHDGTWAVATKAPASTFGDNYYSGDIYRISSNGTAGTEVMISTNTAITGGCAFPCAYETTPVIAMTNLVIHNNQISFTWSGGSTYVHRVQWSTNLLEGIWLDIEGTTTNSTGTTINLTNSMITPSAYYRVVAE